MKKTDKKIYAFIDSQNVNLGIRNQGWQLDFAQFRIYLKDKYNVSKAFLFIGYMPTHKKLYHFLEKAGYTLIYKPVAESKRNAHPIKGNVDAELVIHTMIELPHFDEAVIVSGDGDFYVLVQYLLKQQKLGRLLVPNRKKYSKLFMKFRKKIDFMNNLKEKLALKKGSVVLRTKP